MSRDCESCGNDLNVNAVDRPDIDWVKVVCSTCGRVNEISIVRISGEQDSD